MLLPSTNTLKFALAVALLFPPPSTAQPRYPVVVTPGTPSIWSMEQAHYLLGRLRADNDGLRTKRPSIDDLDPNQINALRLEAIQRRLGVAASLDSVVGAQNQVVLDRFQADQEQMQSLMREADDKRKDLERGKTALADLQGSKTKLEGQIAITPTTKTPAQIEALKNELQAVNGAIKTQEMNNAQLSAQITELEKRTDLSGLKTVNPDASAAKDLDRLLKGSTDALLKKTIDAFDRPKLHSTIVLDNFLQMQYEILAKQLTTLRDEAGDGQRVIFLELPTSISAAAHRYVADGGEGKLAQSWWVVKRIIRRYRLEDSPCFVGDALFERFARSSKIDSSSRTTGISEPTGVQSATAAALEEQKVLGQQAANIRKDIKTLDDSIEGELTARLSKRTATQTAALKQETILNRQLQDVNTQIARRQSELSDEERKELTREETYAQNLNKTRAQIASKDDQLKKATPPDRQTLNDELHRLRLAEGTIANRLSLERQISKAQLDFLRGEILALNGTLLDLQKQERALQDELNQQSKISDDRLASLRKAKQEREKELLKLESRQREVAKKQRTQAAENSSSSDSKPQQTFDLNRKASIARNDSSNTKATPITTDMHKKKLNDKLEAQKKEIEDKYNYLLTQIKDDNLEQTDQNTLIDLIKTIREDILKFEKLGREMSLERERFIAGLSPVELKRYETTRTAVQELESPCRDITATSTLFEKEAFARDSAARERPSAGKLPDGSGKLPDGSELNEGEKERLEKLQDLVKELRKLFAALSEDLLAIHQAYIYQYFGGPELIASAFYSDMENVAASTTGLETGQLRAVELIPRQAALNVNSLHKEVNNSLLSGAWRALFGFGLKVEYQEQREKYNQFLQQEAFASGFGKGQATFGWVFGPLPGSRVLNSGVRNGYAILTVPDDASALQIEGQGCAFHMKHRPPQNYREASANPDQFHCGQKLETLIGIPEVDNSGTFWIDRVNYTHVNPGQRTNIVIHGTYISPQTNVLVNGHRIPQLLGLGKPKQFMDAGSEDEAPPEQGQISGTYEFVNQQQMVVNLSIPKDYSGDFPAITLVAPARAETINGMRLRVNGSPGRKLEDMKILRPAAPAKLTLSAVGLSGYDRSQTNPVRLRLSGKLFSRRETKIRLNGKACDLCQEDVINGTLAYANCPEDPQPSWEVLAYNENANDSATTPADVHTIPNPLLIAINSFEKVAVKYYPTRKPEYYDIQLVGSGFTPRIQLKPRGASNPAQVRLSFRSATELYCRITDPKGDTTIEIEDPHTTKTAAIVIPSPPDEPQEKKPEGPVTVTTVQSELKVTRK